MFEDGPQELGSSHSLDLALGDLDGDGDLDAFVANLNQPNGVWLNDGHGMYSDTGQMLGSASSFGVSLGDLDGDGDLDALVANGGDPNGVWLNDGLGFFSAGQMLGDSESVDVSLGDLDDDGDLDVFVANYNQPNRAWLNDGSGMFSVTDQMLGNSTSREVALGDLDGDGDLDAFVANAQSQPNRVWLNQNSVTSFAAADAGDGFDFLAWQRGYGLMVQADESMGDADGDQDVDDDDFLVWQGQFGQTSASAAALVVLSTAAAADENPAQLVDAAMALAAAKTVADDSDESHAWEEPAFFDRRQLTATRPDNSTSSAADSTYSESKPSNTPDRNSSEIEDFDCDAIEAAFDTAFD
jgi:hypothetical protein